MTDVAIDRVGSLLQIHCEGNTSYCQISDGSINVQGPNGRKTTREDDFPVKLRYSTEGGKLEIWDSNERLVLSTRLLKRAIVAHRETSSVPIVSRVDNDASENLKREVSFEHHHDDGNSTQNMASNSSM